MLLLSPATILLINNLTHIHPGLTVVQQTLLYHGFHNAHQYYTRAENNTTCNASCGASPIRITCGECKYRIPLMSIVPTLLNTQSTTRTAGRMVYWRWFSWQAEETKGWRLLVNKGGEFKGCPFLMSRCRSIFGPDRPTPDDTEKREAAVCQPASVNYLLCLNSAERSRAYRNAGCYNMVEPCKCVCVWGGGTGMGYMCQNNRVWERQQNTDEKIFFLKCHAGF